MRRPNGTGTITKLSGNRRKPYAVRVPARDRYGYITQKALSYHASATEAQQALDEYNAQKRAGTALAIDKLSMTVQQVYDAWSAREYKKLKPASVASHKAAWNKRVSRYAGRKIRSMALDDWQMILDEDENDGLSQSLINNDVILIRALYSYAMERDIVGKDYSQFLDIPSVGAKKKKDSFSDLQLKKLENMASNGFPWADTVLVLCYTGFRISEFLGLTRFSYHPVGGGYLQGGMKTDAGRDRIVPIHPKILPYVKQYLARGDDALIAKDGDPITSSWYRSVAFPVVAKELGVPEATPHWCRHTFATRLHTAGADALTIKWLMGHSTKDDVTSGYTHSTLDVLAQAIKKLA